MQCIWLHIKVVIGKLLYQHLHAQAALVHAPVRCLQSCTSDVHGNSRRSSYVAMYQVESAQLTSSVKALDAPPCLVR